MVAYLHVISKDKKKSQHTNLERNMYNFVLTICLNLYTNNLEDCDNAKI